MRAEKKLKMGKKTPKNFILEHYRKTFDYQIASWHKKAYISVRVDYLTQLKRKHGWQSECRN